MGSSASRPSPLAPTFERMASWDIKAAKRLLADYKEKDLDFGLDAQSLAEICGGDHGWADAIIDAFGGTNGIVNALAYICGAILVSSGAALEKAGLVFDALDFDLTEQISMDEMTIVFLCCARGYCVMSGTGTEPTDEALEHVTLQAYRELSKSGGHSITKTEFTKWVLHFVSAAPSHGEASLEDMAIQFGLIAVPPVKTSTESVLHEIAEENNTIVGDETGGDMAEPPPQEETPVAEDAMMPGDEPTEGEALVQQGSEQEDTDVQEVVAGEAATEPIEAVQDQGEVEVSVVFNEYDDEFQAESPRDDGDTMDRPPSPPVEQAEEDLQAPPEPDFIHADPVGDSHAREETAPDAPTSGDGEPAGNDLQADLNAYDTYDYTDPAFDSSSGLSPPDPFDAQDTPVVSAEPTPRAAVNETDTITADEG